MNDLETNKIVGVFGKLFRVESVLILGALLLMTGAFWGWLDRPIAGWLPGYKIPLSEHLPPIISYGLLSFCAGLVALASVWKRFRWVSILAGGFAWLLSLHFLLAFSILNSKNIIAVNELNQQEGRIIAFNRSLPISFMTNPTFDRMINTDTIEERLYATLHFSTYGWYCAVLGSAILLISLIYSRSNLQFRLILITLIMLVSIAYTMLSILPYIRAEINRSTGDYYLSSGMYIEAINIYTLSQIYDPNYKYMHRFYNTIGKAYYFAGAKDTAELFIYNAQVALSEYNFRLAIYYYNSAIAIDKSIANTVGNELLSIAYIKYGIDLYINKHIESAIYCWKQAIYINSAHIEAYYYLCRAYYDISLYDESLATGFQFLKICTDKIRSADMNSNIGDSYYMINKYAIAREHYLKSIKLVMNGNQRALMNLVGR